LGPQDVPMASGIKSSTTLGKKSWFKFNANQYMPYRVLYPNSWYADL